MRRDPEMEVAPAAGLPAPATRSESILSREEEADIIELWKLRFAKSNDQILSKLQKFRVVWCNLAASRCITQFVFS
jgi:hypothetical protein